MAKYPDFVIASLGANRKDKPNGVVTARVLHDETNGLAVKTQRPGEVSHRVGLTAAAHFHARSRCERGAPAGAGASH